MTPYLKTRIQKAQKLYVAGASMGQVARRLGVSRARVHQWLVLGEQAGLGRVVRPRLLDRTDALHAGLRTATSWRRLSGLLGYKNNENAQYAQQWAVRAGYTREAVLLRFAENRDAQVLDTLWDHCVRLGALEVQTTLLQRDPHGSVAYTVARRRFGSIETLRRLLEGRKKAHSATSRGLDKGAKHETVQEGPQGGQLGRCRTAHLAQHEPRGTRRA